MNILALSSATMTPAVCAFECQQLNQYSFFALEYGVQCWCGNNPNIYGPSNACDYPCSGNLNFTCGGFFSMTVYAIASNQGSFPIMTTTAFTQSNENLAYVGCYLDDAKARALSAGTFTDVAMTPTKCFSLCSAAGNFQYIGLQYGTQCWCGSTPFIYGQAQQGSCNTECGGNYSIICGGYFSNSVYSITRSSTSATSFATSSAAGMYHNFSCKCRVAV